MALFIYKPEVDPKALHIDGSNSPIADISWGNHKITNLSEIDFDANYRIVFDAAHNNIGFGYAPLNSNTTGHSLIGIGYKVLYDNTTGYENTAIGTNALRYNVSGYRNSAYGKRSLYKNTTGYDNTAVGMESLWANTTGIRNTAIGNKAFYSNIGGNNNTAIGVEALYTCTGDKNVAVGEQALALTSTGSYNVAIGNQALCYNTTGSHNVGIGYWAGSRNTQSNRLIIDAYDRGLEANEPTQCLIYGIFDPTPSNQQLTINAGTIKISGNLNSSEAGLYNIGSQTAPFSNIFLGDISGNVFKTEWSADSLKLKLKNKPNAPFLDLIIEGQGDTNGDEYGGDLILKTSPMGNILFQRETFDGTYDMFYIRGAANEIRFLQSVTRIVLESGILTIGGIDNPAFAVKSTGSEHFVSVEGGNSLVFRGDNMVDLGYYNSMYARPRNVYVGTSVEIASSLNLNSNSVYVTQDTGYSGKLDASNAYRFATGNFKSGITVGCKGGETGKILLGGASRSYFDSSGTLIASNTSYLEGDASSNIFIKNSAGSSGFSFDPNLNVTVGVGNLAVSATDGFPYIPLINGVPTGTPTSKSGYVPIAFDSANDKLYVYDAGWIAIGGSAVESDPLSLHLDGSNAMSGHINSSGVGLYDIGSSTAPFKSLYLGDGTVTFKTDWSTNQLTLTLSDLVNSPSYALCIKGQNNVYYNGGDVILQGGQYNGNIKLLPNNNGRIIIGAYLRGIASDSAELGIVNYGVGILSSGNGRSFYVVSEYGSTNGSIGTYLTSGEIGQPERRFYNGHFRNAVTIGAATPEESGSLKLGWHGSGVTGDFRSAKLLAKTGLGARRNHACVYIPTHNLYFFYGGGFKMAATGWGGYQLATKTGVLYDPVKNKWKFTSVNPYETIPRNYMGACFLADPSDANHGRVFIFGGAESGTNLGFIYDVNSDSWSTFSSTNAPSMRPYPFTYNIANNQVLVWGGCDFSGANYRKDGKIYHADTNTWTDMAPCPDGLATRYSYGVDFLPASGTSGKMVMWGGRDVGGTYYNTGYVYDVATNLWSSTTTTGAPSARMCGNWLYGAGVGINDRFFVWGGYNGTILGDGAIYNPATDSWSAIASPGSLRYAHVSHFTGTTTNKVIIWGGNNGGYLNTGLIYDITGNSWSSMATPDIEGRGDGLTGQAFSIANQQFCIIGGAANTEIYASGGVYNVSSNTWQLTPIYNTVENKCTDNSFSINQTRINKDGTVTDLGTSLVSDDKFNVAIGLNNLTTSSTDGFIYIPAAAGAPTGIPTSKTGFAPLYVDTLNHRLYIYESGIWKYAALT